MRPIFKLVLALFLITTIVATAADGVQALSSRMDEWITGPSSYRVVAINPLGDITLRHLNQELTARCDIQFLASCGHIQVGVAYTQFRWTSGPERIRHPKVGEYLMVQDAANSFIPFLSLQVVGEKERMGLLNYLPLP